METECYSAFISYRHKEFDTNIAQKIQSFLEHYNIPPQIAKKTGYKHVKRIFRDSDELPTTISLPESLRNALDNSDFLIVICTPSTPDSSWVTEEIRYFADKHNWDKILPVLAYGEPIDSFPKILQEHSEEISRHEDGYFSTITSLPLAADVRGKNNNVIRKKIRREGLRLVSAILKCGYDELVQRHRQYKFRLLSMFAVALFIVLSSICFMLLRQNQRIRENYQAMQINQSYYLSDVSGDLLKSGDRLGAVQVAMAALPTENQERPYIADAELALSNALYAYENDNTLRADVAIKGKSQFEDIKLSNDGQYIVTYDVDGVFWCFNTKTGANIWEKELDLNDSVFTVYGFNFVDSENVVLVTGPKRIYALALSDGSVLWQYSSNADYCEDGGLSVSQDIYALYEHNDNHSLSVLLFETATGALLNSYNLYEGDRGVYTQPGIFSEDDCYYLGVFSTDLEQDTTTIVQVDIIKGQTSIIRKLQPKISAAIYEPKRNDIVLVTLKNENNSTIDDMVESQFSYSTIGVRVERIAQDSKKNTWVTNYNINNTVGWGKQSIKYCLTNGGSEPVFFCIVGRELCVMQSSDGQIIQESYLKTGIAGVFQTTDHLDWVFLALLDGTFDAFDPESGALLSQSGIQFNLDIATSCVDMQSGTFAVISPSRYEIVVFRFIGDEHAEEIMNIKGEISEIEYLNTEEKLLVFTDDVDSEISSKGFILDVVTQKVEDSFVIKKVAKFFGFLSQETSFVYQANDEKYYEFNWITGVNKTYPIPDRIDLALCDVVGHNGNYALLNVTSSNEGARTLHTAEFFIPKTKEFFAFDIPAENSDLLYSKDETWGENGYLAFRLEGEEHQNLYFFSTVTNQQYVVDALGQAENGYLTAMADTKDLYAEFDSDRYLRVYQIQNGECVVALPFETKAVNWLKFFQNDEKILCAYGDNKLMIINVKTNEIDADISLDYDCWYEEEDVIYFDHATNELFLSMDIYGGVIIDTELYSAKAYVNRNCMFFPEYQYLLALSSNAIEKYPIYSTEELLSWGKEISSQQPLSDGERVQLYIKPVITNPD